MTSINVLITGATGFIGYRLAEYLLKKNYKIYCLARDSSKTDLLKNKAEIVNLDLKNINELDDSLIKNLDYVYHFAGITKHYDKNKYYEINYERSKNFVDKIISANPSRLKRFMFCSSQAAAGPTENLYLMKETDEPNPINSYGKSKKSAEDYILKHKDKLNSLIIRPPAVFGFGERDILTYFQMIEKGIMPFAGKGNLTFSIIYAEDLVKAAVNLSENPNVKSGEIFFTANTDYYSMKEFCGLIAKTANKNPFKIYIPIPFIKILGNLNEIIGILLKKTFLLNKEKLLELSKNYWVCSNEKMKKNCPDIIFTDIQAALKDTYEWYKKNNWL